MRKQLNTGSLGVWATLFTAFCALVALGSPRDAQAAAPLVASAPHGRILITTRHSGEPALARLTRDGRIDKRFGDHGYVTFGLQDRASLTGLLVKPDGSVDLAYQPACFKKLCPLHAYVVQLNADGKQDETFGDGGRVLAQHARLGGSPGGLALAPDGDLLLAGWNRTEPCGQGLDCAHQQFVVKLEGSGTPDPGFGIGGTARITDPELTMDITANPVAVDGSGRVLTGESGSGLIARFLSDGTPDPSFGSGLGYVETAVPVDGLIPVQGGLLAGGALRNDNDEEVLGLTKLTDTGGVDASFAGGDGVFTLKPGKRGFGASGSLTPDGSGGELLSAQIGQDCKPAQVKFPRNCRMSTVIVDLSADGIPQSSFGNGGVVKTQLTRFRTCCGFGASAFLRPNGLAIGTVASYGPRNEDADLESATAPVVVGFTSSGRPDTEFGAGGTARLPIDWCPGQQCPVVGARLHASKSSRIRVSVRQPHMLLRGVRITLPKAVSLMPSRVKHVVVRSGGRLLKNPRVDVTRHTVTARGGARNARAMSVSVRCGISGLARRSQIALSVRALHQQGVPDAPRHLTAQIN